MEGAKLFSQRYIIGYTRVLYCMGFLPYRLALRRSSGTGTIPGLEVERKWNVFQNVACILIHSFLFISNLFMTWVLLHANVSSSEGSLSFLMATLLLTGPSIASYFIYTAWFRSEWFMWVLSQLHSSTSTTSFGGTVKPYSVLEKFQNYLAIISPIITVPAALYSLNGAYAEFFQRYVLQLGMSCLEDDDGGGFWKVMKRLILYVACHIQVMTGQVLLFAFHTMILSFRDKARMFVHMIEEQVSNEKIRREEQNKQQEIVLGKYLELEEFTNGINERFGGWALTIIVSSIPFNSLKLMDLLKWEGSMIWANVLTFLYTFSFYFWLCTVARGSNQVCTGMKNWLYRNYSHLSPQQLAIFICKVTQDGVALRGGNFMPISYSLIGTVISLSITWTFIDQRNNQIVLPPPSE